MMNHHVVIMFVCLLTADMTRGATLQPPPLSIVSSTAGAITRAIQVAGSAADSQGDATTRAVTTPAAAAIGSSSTQSPITTMPNEDAVQTTTKQSSMSTTITPSTTTTTTITTSMQSGSPTTRNNNNASSFASSPPSSSSATFSLSSSTTATPEYAIPHRIPTQLEEKLESLSCDLPLLPNESRLWKGNETHELLLPITIPEECPEGARTTGGNEVVATATEPSHLDCSPPILSWEGAIEIQSGDVLLVRIDDARLIRDSASFNRTTQRLMQEPPTAVYQVTRTGHDNCDVTEGVLLDITPLKIDDRKVVTLYDKDLTEGINLLIVVSELWGNQCVRLKVIVKSDNCGENEDCSGKGLCYSNVSMEGYECQCCPGFVGPHCEEQDACYPSPCRNNGICVDITQGHEGSTFQCLCPYGYTGKTCEEETDPCTSMPCQNGANCTGNVTQFHCECPKGFSGSQCQHSMNECESSPCVHGICVDQEDGYRCFCQPGFTGLHCEYEYNECESSPCINGGTCTDHIGYYVCSCGRGFTGKRCHIKVDLCEPNPCFEPRYCKDRGNNYSCECPKGFTGPDCLVAAKAACSTNPCANGGTCWSSVDSFYCACKPGFTGKTCEDEFVVEKISDLSSTTRDNEEMDIDLQIPVSIQLDHLHNAYIAVGTLLSAVIIVAIIVTACHCRVNKTYRRFSMRTNLLWSMCQGRRTATPEVVTHHNQHHHNQQHHPANTEWFSGKDKAPMATPSRSLPSLDTTDMYYTLDFSDSQRSPLIQ